MHWIRGRLRGSAATLALLSLSILSASSPASSAPLTSVVGTLVEVSPEDRSILLRSGEPELAVILRRFEVAESARIRVNGAVARFADVRAGQRARVDYVRVDGRSLAELVDVLDAVPASGALASAREETGIESRRRYLEDMASALDVVEESIEELARHSGELESSDALARRKATVEELKEKLAHSRVVLASLSATSGREAWRRGVDQMNAALEALEQAHQRGWSEVAIR